MNLKEKLMADRLLLLILLASTGFNVYYAVSRNLFSDGETISSKILVMLMPYVVYALFLFIPEMGNEKLLIKNGNIVVFIINIAVILSNWIGIHRNMQQILAILFSMLICLFGGHLKRIKKSNEMWGLKTPWTGNSIDHLYQTNQFGGRLLNFVGILSIVSSYWIGPLFAVTMILASVLAIYGFSYSLSKKK